MLDGWEADALRWGLGTRPDGRWAAMRVGLIVPRQNGKGSVLEALELAGLFLFDERLIIHSAHEFKTAQEGFLRVLELVQSTPDLDRLVMRVRTSHGEEGIEVRRRDRGRNRLRFVARSRSSGRGFTGDRVILDEAFELPASVTSALIPTMSAKSITGNPQVWFTSSAPHDTEGSTILRSLCREGRRGSESLAYTEFCAPDGSDLDDWGAWAAANPGFGVRISGDFIEQMERTPLMTDADFARERLGFWRADESEDRVIPAPAWAAVSDRDASPAGQVVFGLDVNDDRTHAAIVAVGGNRHVEVVDHPLALADLADRVGEYRKFSSSWAVNASGPAGACVTDLERAGCTVVDVSGRNFNRACGELYDDIGDQRVRFRSPSPLDDMVARARKKMSGDAWCWKREGDITGLVAATVALHVARLVPVPSVVNLADYVED